MRRLLQLLAWLLARVGGVLALCFAVLSSATRSDDDSWRNTRIEAAVLPRFFNGTPSDLRWLVKRQLTRLKTGESPDASAVLRRLGTAAIPIALGAMGSYDAKTQERIADALLPIAERVGTRTVQNPDEDTTAAARVRKFWNDREADYQPNLVARWVDRLARRDNPGLRATVIEYDTFALPALIASMSVVAESGNVPAVQRLTEVASRITGHSWSIAPSSSAADARVMVAQWNRWWLFHHTDYTALSGPARWSAMLTETLFGKWLTLAFSPELMQTKGDLALWPLVVPAGQKTLLLLLCATLGPWLVTYLPAYRISQLGGSSVRLLLDRGGQALSAVPLVSWVIACSALQFVRNSLVAAAMAVALATTIGACGNALSLALRASPLRTSGTGAPGVHRDRRARSALQRLLRQWHFAGHYWPFSLLLAFCSEEAFRIDGLARLTVRFFHQRDLCGLMAVTCFSAISLLFVESAVQYGRRMRDAEAAGESASP